MYLELINACWNVCDEQHKPNNILSELSCNKYRLLQPTLGSVQYIEKGKIDSEFGLKVCYLESQPWRYTNSNSYVKIFKIQALITFKVKMFHNAQKFLFICYHNAPGFAISNMPLLILKGRCSMDCCGYMYVHVCAYSYVLLKI